MNKSVIRVVQELDQLKALLRTAFKALGQETQARILADLDRDFHDPDAEPGVRLYDHMALVGLLTMMTETIDSADQEAGIDND